MFKKPKKKNIELKILKSLSCPPLKNHLVQVVYQKSKTNLVFLMRSNFFTLCSNQQPVKRNLQYLQRNILTFVLILLIFCEKQSGIFAQKYFDFCFDFACVVKRNLKYLHRNTLTFVLILFILNSEKKSWLFAQIYFAICFDFVRLPKIDLEYLQRNTLT